MISHSTIGSKSKAGSSNAFYEADAQSFEELRGFSDLAKKSKQLKRQPKLMDSMTMEPTSNLQLVGIDQEPSDSFTPEELVAMFHRKPLTVDWDKRLNYA
jgi:hypothetical protein